MHFLISNLNLLFPPFLYRIHHSTNCFQSKQVESSHRGDNRLRRSMLQDCQQTVSSDAAG